MDIVVACLGRLGPCLSPRLAEELVAAHGMSPAAARQRVSRITRTASVNSLAYVTFPHKARFVYLPKDYASPRFWDALVTALLEHSISYGGALASVIARGGMMPLKHFAIACGAPLAQKRHLSPTAILERLATAKLVQTRDVPGVGDCVELSQQVAADTSEVAKMQARLQTERILLLAIKDWAKKLGLVSFDKVALRDEDPSGTQPRVATFAWDMTAPSYLHPMLDWTSRGMKQGFLAVDVLLGTTVSASDLRPFLAKCETLRGLKSVGRCIQMFVAERYEEDAFKLAKTAGVIPATSETLFGREVAAGLSELTSLLSTTFLQPDVVERLDVVFSALGRIEGAAINLRGALFEFIVAEVVRRTSAHQSIKMNEVIVGEDSRRAEVDVLVENHGKLIRFIECRGYQPGAVIDDAMVERWLNDRIPLLRKFASEESFWKGCHFQFEFWTTGLLSEVARERIHAVQVTVRPTKYTVKLVDGPALKEIVRDLGDTSLRETLSQHFIEHPLSTVDREVVRQRARAAKGAGRVNKREVYSESESFDNFIASATGDDADEL